MRHMTPQEIAMAYAETIYGPANGWGQHVHRTLGRSDFIMLKLRNLVGDDESDRLIDKAMKEYADNIKRNGVASCG